MLSSFSYDAAPSVNHEEVKFFNNLSSEWWDDKNGGAKVLHPMNKKVAELVEKCAIDAGLAKSEFSNTATPLKDVLILDVGCGGGILSEPLARTSATVIGLDMAPDLIQVAKEHASLDSSLTNLTYVLQSVEEHSVENSEKYDVVVASGLLEHVDNPELFLQACLRCLRPGGVIVLTTFDKTFIAWLLGIIAMEYVLRMIPIGTHDWNKFVPIEDAKNMLKNKNADKYDVMLTAGLSEHVDNPELFLQACVRCLTFCGFILHDLQQNFHGMASGYNWTGVCGQESSSWNLLVE